MLAFLVLSSAVVWASITDIRSRIISDKLTLPLIGLGIGFNLLDSLFASRTLQDLGAVGIISSLSGCVAVFTILFVIIMHSGGGAGDLKLATGLGAWLGLEGGLRLVMSTYIVCGLAIAISFALSFAFKVVTGRNSQIAAWANQEIPIAPFFAVATWFVLLTS